MQIPDVVRIYYFEDFAGRKPAERIEGRRPPANLKARLGMLEFRDIRRGIAEGAEDLARYFSRDAVEAPKDLHMRFARIAYAMYLLDTLDRVLRMARQDSYLLSEFESARKAVRELLDEGYFRKSADQIISSYERLAEPLERCVNLCGMELLLPEQAVESFKLRLADMIDAVNGHCV